MVSHMKLKGGVAVTCVVGREDDATEDQKGPE